VSRFLEGRWGFAAGVADERRVTGHGHGDAGAGDDWVPRMWRRRLAEAVSLSGRRPAAGLPAAAPWTGDGESADAGEKMPAGRRSATGGGASRRQAGGDQPRPTDMGAGRRGVDRTGGPAKSRRWRRKATTMGRAPGPFCPGLASPDLAAAVRRLHSTAFRGEVAAARGGGPAWSGRFSRAARGDARRRGNARGARGAPTGTRSGKVPALAPEGDARLVGRETGSAGR